MARRETVWARWLGWTAGYAMMMAGTAAVLGLLGGVPALPMIATAAGAAFAVGARFRDPRWVLGPPTVVVGAVLAAVAVAALRPQVAAPGPLGASTPLDDVAFFLVVGFPVLVAAALLPAAAALGVRWGRRRWPKQGRISPPRSDGSGDFPADHADTAGG